MLRWDSGWETHRVGGWRVRWLRVQDDERNTTVRLVPAMGCNIIGWEVDGTEYLVASEPDGRILGTPILYPMPNRVRDGVFSFDGREFRFAPNNGPNFTPGLVRDVLWELDEPEATVDGVSLTARVAMAPGTPLYELFPISNTLTLRLLVALGRLELAFTVHNDDRAPPALWPGDPPLFPPSTASRGCDAAHPRETLHGGGIAAAHRAPFAAGCLLGRPHPSPSRWRASTWMTCSGDAGRSSGHHHLHVLGQAGDAGSGRLVHPRRRVHASRGALLLRGEPVVLHRCAQPVRPRANCSGTFDHPRAGAAPMRRPSPFGWTTSRPVRCPVPPSSPAAVSPRCRVEDPPDRGGGWIRMWQRSARWPAKRGAPRAWARAPS